MTPGDPLSSLEVTSEPGVAALDARDSVDGLTPLGTSAATGRTGRTGRTGQTGHKDRPKRTDRPSRWDREPEPRDWRWVIGGIGRVLISVGVLMFAFVGYQLYGTGIQTAQAQNRLENEFEELLAATGAPAGTDLTTPAEVPDTVAATVPATVDSTETTSPPPPSTVPAARLTPPPQGEPLAKITIESIDVEWIVIEGVRTSDLQDGPGHFPETPLPGQLGNSAIAGHRTTHGQPFNRIDEVQVGDTVVIETVVGRYTYVVTGQVIVSPNDYQLVIPTIDPTIATLALTSCHPKFSARERIVISAVLDPERSDVVTAAYVPPEADDIAPSAIPGADDVVTSTDLAVPATDPAVSTPAAPEPVTTASGSGGDVVADDTGTPSTPPDVDDTANASQDLFENRWFSDPDAFPQVALWGTALIVVALGATAISRRARRNWLGALIGITPFIVVLYFWFQNVNRLLPPNL